MSYHRYDEYPSDLLDQIYCNISKYCKNNQYTLSIIDELAKCGDVYFLGGIVRDTLLHREFNDIDLVMCNEQNQIIFPSSDKLKHEHHPYINFIKPNYKSGYKIYVNNEDPTQSLSFGTKVKKWTQRYKADEKTIDLWPSTDMQKEVASTVMAFNSIAVHVKTGEVVSTTKADQFYSAPRDERFLSINMERVSAEWERCKHRVKRFKFELNLPYDPEYVLVSRMRKHMTKSHSF